MRYNNYNFMPHKITQAVILCAGLGTRLRPLTDMIPKVMVPIAGRPLLERHIERLKGFGIDELFINLHYLPEIITEYCGDGSRWGVKIHYSFEPKILGTGGGIKQFEKDLDDNFLVVYGDMVSLINYSNMIKEYFEKENPIGITAVGDRDERIASVDLVEVDEYGKFVEIYPRPHSRVPEHHKAFLAGHIFNKRILSYIPPDVEYSIDLQAIPEAFAKGENFYAYDVDAHGEYIEDIGTLELYKKVEQYFLEKGL